MENFNPQNMAPKEVFQSVQEVDSWLSYIVLDCWMWKKPRQHVPLAAHRKEPQVCCRPGPPFDAFDLISLQSIEREGQRHHSETALGEEQYNKDMTLKEAEILALTTLRQASGKVPFLHIFACQSFAAPQPAMYYNLILSLFIYDTRYTWLSPEWFVELSDFVWGILFLAGHGREVEQIQHRGWSGASIYWQVFGLSITTKSKVSRMCGSAAQLVDSFTMTAWLWGSAVTMQKNLKMWLLACMEPKSSTALHSWSSQGAELFPGCTEASAMTRFPLRR